MVKKTISTLAFALIAPLAFAQTSTTTTDQKTSTHRTSDARTPRRPEACRITFDLAARAGRERRIPRIRRDRGSRGQM